MAYVEQATALAKAKGLARHLDGARLFNAAVAQAQSARAVEGHPDPVRPELVEGHAKASLRQAQDGLGTARTVLQEARRIASCFDSVSVCFSKGLGAPVGSALCGSRETIARARRVRKMAGGAMRQAGMLAAAASYALDHHVERLAQDHALAAKLAQGLSAIEGLQVETPQTNMVFVDVTGPAREKAVGLVGHLAGEGVLAMGLYRLRFATHLDVDEAGVERAVAAIRRYFES
jgi:threonine aldolase